MNQTTSITADFQHHLLADGKSAKTVASYVSDVQAFLNWIEEKGAEFSGDIKRFHITSYKKFLLESDYSPNTVNKKINSLKAFNDYLLVSGKAQSMAVDVRRDKVKVATGSEGEVEILMDDEVERLLFRMQERITNSQRDRLLVILLLYTGLRVSEAVSVRLKDIDFLTLQLKVFGKGGKFREVPLRNEVIEATREYMEGERKASRFSGSDFLFVSQRSSKLDRDTVNKILRRISGKVNIRLHPHIFRHTFCDRLLKKGVPITTVSRLAGHSSIQTTASYYINTSRKDKTEAVELL